jgi:glycosyltransferase involved in cell wall biosynthesis
VTVSAVPMPVPVVHVLLATYNGERHLPQQWASLEGQQGVELVVHLADDGSSDGTVALLQRLEAARSGAVREVRWMHAAPRRSAGKSFMLLLAHALRECPDAGWFAYCDQDDIWLPGKLAAAVQALAPRADAGPVLYGGRTLAVDEDDREQGLSPLFVQAPCFRNAIVQNIMGGNTMVMNRAAAELVAESAGTEVVTHDWFTYQIVAGAGGFVHYDPRPFLRYRQHGNNAIGSNVGWRALGSRFLRMLKGEFRSWNEVNGAALGQRMRSLTPVNADVLRAFLRARTAASPWSRLAWLRRSGAFRQPHSQQIVLRVACALRRI